MDCGSTEINSIRLDFSMVKLTIILQSRTTAPLTCTVNFRAVAEPFAFHPILLYQAANHPTRTMPYRTAELIP